VVSEPFFPPLVRGLPAGISRARLPTPFPVGTVNCYLLTEPPVTLVDPGTLTAASLKGLRALLAGAGCALDDIEQVVVTHAHPDHFGAAAWVARRSGGVILAGRDEVPAIRGESGSRLPPELMTSLGVPRGLVDQVGAAWGAVRVVEWADTAEVEVVPVDDGDIVRAGGRSLTAHVTPGHASGHLSLWSEDARLLMSGDHLLGRIVPLAALEPSPDGGHRKSLREYLASLDRFVSLDPAVVLPGHGASFTGVEVLARRLVVHHEDRCASVRGVVAELGRPTPYEVAQRLLWQADGSRLIQGVAEAVGHLDLLEAEGDVVVDAEGAELRYRIAG
jgi:glyoxylase-like metal-dependent hydrolase (beta-lactamase superfamily II)